MQRPHSPTEEDYEVAREFVERMKDYVRDECPTLLKEDERARFFGLGEPRRGIPLEAANYGNCTIHLSVFAKYVGCAVVVLGPSAMDPQARPVNSTSHTLLLDTEPNIYNEWVSHRGKVRCAAFPFTPTPSNHLNHLRVWCVRHPPAARQAIGAC
jgi:hypothetical protein